MARIDECKLKLPPYYPDHPVAYDEYANYLEAIELVDKHVGMLFERLQKEGIADNTLVIFMGDNGSCTFRGKQFLYEGGIRVPLLVRWPGRVSHGTVRQDLISSVDLVAATLAAAGVEPPSSLHGRDFLEMHPDAITYLRHETGAILPPSECAVSAIRATNTSAISCRRFLICRRIRTKKRNIRPGIWLNSFTAKAS